MLAMLTATSMAMAETLTMTTYYPSPVGVYQSLRLAPNNSPPACGASTAGTLYVDSSNVLYYCDGTAPYSRSIGEWDLNGSDLYPVDYATVSVGIGTNLPAARLHVEDSNASSTGIRIKNSQTTGAVWELRAHEANPNDGFTIWGGNEGVETTRLTILDTGEVGIATTAPATMLHVEGNTTINGDLNMLGGTRVIQSSGGLQYLISGAGNYVYDLPAGGIFTVRDASGPTELLTVREDTLRVGINNPAPTSALDVVGSVTATAFLYSSDATLKENFQSVPGLEGIMQLDGLSYTWKEDGAADIGITAQDVEAVYPALVHTDEAGRKYVKYGNMIAPMIEAIKDQQQLIEQQSQQINAMRLEIDELKRKLE